MFSIVFDKFSVFYSVFLVSLVIASDLKEDNIDRGSRSDKAGLWFGPRLGKRSLEYNNDGDKEGVLSLLKAAEAVRLYFDQIRNYDSVNDDDLPTYSKEKKKMIFTPRPGRTLKSQKKVIFIPRTGRTLGDQLQPILDEERQYENVDFTPRLGRRLPDKIPATPADPDVYKSGPIPEPIDSTVFSPRLGRNLDYSPRLGRNMNYTPRLGRDMTFTPRLGRDMTFTPRLGRDMTFTPRLGRDMTFTPRLGRDMTFTPRLGRDITFSPRLGRELDFDVSPETVRVVRSANTTKTT